MTYQQSIEDPAEESENSESESTINGGGSHRKQALPPQIVNQDVECSDIKSTHSDGAENFTDPSFENELTQFKLRLI